METVILKEKFSKAAENYDEASLIQREIADELFMQIKLNDASNILDIGMGTGYLTEKIKSKYPHLEVYGLDLALGMLHKTKKKMPQVKLTQADAQNLPFLNETFDIVISNLAYQWLVDLDSAFRESRRVLKNEGRFYFTIFLENTLKELKQAVFTTCNSATGNLKLDTIANLPSKYFVESLLKLTGFKNIRMNLKSSKCYYSNLADLLNWLKLIGANKYWLNNFYKGLSARSFVDKLTKYYEEKFRDNGKIFATFEVLFIEAEK